MEPSAYLEMAATEDRHWWFVGRRAVLTSVLEQLALPSDATILEVGCGTGGNLRMLSNFGRVSGLEMDARAIEIAHEKTGPEFDIRAGACPNDVPFEAGTFDLICLFDVLEHVAEDRETLTALARLLKPNGRMLISVPAYPWLWSAHDEFLHHKRRYTKRTLRDTAHAAGMKIRRLSYFNTFLFPIAVAARMKDRVFKTATASGMKMPPRVLNGALGAIFGFERFLLRAVNLPFGLSILAILARDEKPSAA